MFKRIRQLIPRKKLPDIPLPKFTTIEAPRNRTGIVIAALVLFAGGGALFYFGTTANPNPAPLIGSVEIPPVAPKPAPVTGCPPKWPLVTRLLGLPRMADVSEFDGGSATFGFLRASQRV